MRYAIDFAEAAVEDLGSFRVYDRVTILDLIEKHLRYDPTKESKSRIKALRGLSRPQYRLRIGDVRVFYDVNGSTVEVIAVVDKTNVSKWFDQEGVPIKTRNIDENSGTP